MSVKTIIIHCSATKPLWYKSRSAEEKASEIRRWHVEDNGWSDIGYHYIIDRDGAIAKGRDESVQGAHVKGHNEDSIGVCLIGGFGGNVDDSFFDHFTESQDKALKILIKDIQSRWHVATIKGHNEYAAKACPCFNVRKWLRNKNLKGGKMLTDKKTIAPTRKVKAGGIAAAISAWAVAAFTSRFPEVGAALGPLVENLLIAAVGFGASYFTRDEV